jgi:hypothetical protein
MKEHTSEYYKGYIDGHISGLIDAEATYNSGWLAGFEFSEATFEHKGKAVIKNMINNELKEKE